MERIELLLRIMCDVRPRDRVDGAYLFGQTVDNQKSVFLAAQRIIKDSLSNKILIIDTEAMSGFPGFGVWENKLRECGISRNQINSVTAAETPILNTLIEAEAMVRFAKSCAFEALYIVAAPFHQPRAFITSVSVVLREYPELQVYSFPGETLPWEEKVAHSQGLVKGSRRSLINEEMVRIKKYQETGDLVSFQEVINYLNRRDHL